MPVAGEPLIRRIVALAGPRASHDLVLNLHHRPETLDRALGDGSDLGARVRYSWEQPACSAAPAARARRCRSSAPTRFFIVNGDTLTDCRSRSVSRRRTHRPARSVTLALVPNREPTRYGGVRLDADGARDRIRARGPAAQGSCHFIGVQIGQRPRLRVAAGPDSRPARSAASTTR